jgi:hypothetical protein
LGEKNRPAHPQPDKKGDQDEERREQGQRDQGSGDVKGAFQGG